MAGDMSAIRTDSSRGEPGTTAVTSAESARRRPLWSGRKSCRVHPPSP